jgi:hypothetical protein
MGGWPTATVYLLFAKQLRDSALPKVVNRFMKGISVAFRRGTIAQATTHQAPRP